MHNGIAIALAWPETFCKQAGSWYDHLMYMLGVNEKGYYKVGHAAIVLVDGASGLCHYFDFGRYHAPHGFGRVRSAKTDHDLIINTKAIIDENEIVNLDEILLELFNNPSTHGTGVIHGSQISVDFRKSFQLAMELQGKDFIQYGPFVSMGTNCSRFVNSILRASCAGLSAKIVLGLPWMLTPTPIWNLKALRKEIVSVGEELDIEKVSFEKPEMQFNL